MRAECSHIQSTGQNCHCLALRGRSFCRHHTSETLPPPSPRSQELFSRLTRWRNLARTVQTLPADDIPFNVFIILGSLIADGEDGISDREAGRLLRALLRRHGSIPALPPAGVTFEPDPADPEPAPPSPAPINQPRTKPRPLPDEIAQMFDPKLLDQLLESYNPNAPLPPGPRLR